MDTHNRFLKHRTKEVFLLLNLTTKNLSTVFKNLVDGFNRDIQALDELGGKLEYLETVHTVLCSFYQRIMDPTLGVEYDEIMYEFTDPLENMNAREVLEAIYRTEKLDDNVLSLILDILVLQMTIYSSSWDPSINVDEFRLFLHSRLGGENEIEIVDIKLLDCFMDIIVLSRMWRGDTAVQGLDRLEVLFQRKMNIWLQSKDREKCKLLTLLLPKIINLMDPKNSSLRQLLHSIFPSGDNTETILSTLCLTADTWFPMESDCNKQLLDLAMKESFWLVLQNGLTSPIPQQRKQALYLIKRAVDFIDKHKSRVSESDSYEKIKPLVCIGDDSQQTSFKKSLNNYILVLEALEEKQKHLVMPVFPLWTTLLKDTFGKENDQDGLHVAWIRCAFARMLQHDNNAVVKWGLLNAFTLGPELYDNDLLSRVLDVMNNTYLYENDSNGEEPAVVIELTKFLNNAESKNSDLVSRFLVKASKMTWGPIALYYVIHAISMVKQLTSVWREAELDAIKSLAEINLTMHCRILRIGSQIEILEALTIFATETPDLVAVANTLSAFSTSEALIRGQLAWKRIATWLSKMVTKGEALHFVEKICGQITNYNSPRDVNVKSFSLMIILFHDGNLILDSKSCPALTALRNLLHCLTGAESRPYVNEELRNVSIGVIHHLLDFISPKESILHELISDFADPCLRFIFKNLRKVSDEALVDNIRTYVAITQRLFTAESSIISKRDVLNHIERFEVESLNIIEDGLYSNNIQRFFGIQILHACLKAMSTKLRNYRFIEPLCKNYKIPMIQSSRHAQGENSAANENANLKGKVAAVYYKLVAELFHEYLGDVPNDEWLADVDWIDQVSYLIDIGGNDIFVPVVGILSQIFYKQAVKATDIDRFKNAIRLCWSRKLESNECRLATEKMIDLILSSPFLECEETKELSIECAREVIEKGDQYPGLSIDLLKGLKKIKETYLYDFHEAILACLLHGAVPRRDQKIELQARSHILDRYQEVYPNYLCNMNVNPSVAIRAHAFTLLHKMITDDPAHAVKLLPLIAKQLDKTQNKRYFGDSQIHRVKNRIMQVLLMLQPILPKPDIESLHTLMCANILSESSQPSVRIMQEWLLIRIYLDSETLRAKIWDLIDQGQEKRVGSLCSAVSIIYHVAQLLPSDLQPNFIDLALQHIMPCCMAQQFNVRLYAQIIAFKLYELAAVRWHSTITNKYRELYDALKKSLKHGNLMKNSIKIQDDFYFTVFNPNEDYSLQTLFYELPRLSNVSSDEHIPPQIFEKFGFKESNSHPIKLLNPKCDVSEALVSDHMLKSAGSAGPAADEPDSIVEGSTDIQKKFIPWKSMSPNEDELSEMSETIASRQRPSNEVILVASLIEKLPNLGGLSRTCEILGVREFVVSSIKHTEDKEFQSLSVSAEKLITLVEVKPHQLQRYLCEKKHMGYRLVGAEQTANSTNLMDMQFEKKTVLLLGNEKAGIPANLIPMLDQCVEIPQVGVVRSLNVHVTGAICLWEYFKQHHSLQASYTYT